MFQSWRGALSTGRFHVIVKQRLFPTELLVRGTARVHEGLSNHRETRINNVGFAEIKHKVWVLYQVDPEPGNTER